MKNNTVIQFSAFLLFFFVFLYSGNAQIAQKIGVNPGSITSSAVLDVESTTKGFLPPRMTTTQRNNILNPATGLSIFNTDTNLLEINTGTAALPDFRNATAKVFSYQNLNNQNIIVGINVNINSGNQIINDFGAGAINVGNSTFTTPESGKYLVNCFFRITAGVWRLNDEVSLILLVDGVESGRASSFASAANTYRFFVGGSFLVSLNANQTIRPQITLVSGLGKVIEYFDYSIVKL